MAGSARTGAAFGSALFFVIAPGTVAGLVPWLLTGWSSGDGPLAARVAGALLLIGSLGVLVPAFARFAVEGLGTPAPVAPTEHLVVGGLYRHVRNPMYMAVVGAILGQALVLWRAEPVVWALIAGAAMALFVRLHEEPALRRRHGAAYDDYRAAVPGWRPRLTPAPRYRRHR